MGLLTVNKGTEARRTSTTASKSPEKLTVRFCNHFYIIPSRLVYKKNTNGTGIKCIMHLIHAMVDFWWLKVGVILLSKQLLETDSTTPTRNYVNSK